MKRVYASLNSAEVGLAQSRLEAAGILCELRNDLVSQAFPTTPFAPEVWVREEDYEMALQLLAEVKPRS
jgi:hypothetical protein